MIIITENYIVAKLIQEGDNLLQNGHLDAAEKKYHEALVLNPNSAEALYSIGAIYNNRGDFQNALEWAEIAIVADSNFRPAYALLGNVLFGLNRYEDAIEMLALADKSNLMAYGQIGLCYEKLERWEEAEEDFRAVLEDDLTYLTRNSFVALYNYDPFFADVHHALARVLQHQGKIEEAKLHYHLTKRIDPTTPLDPMYLEITSESDLDIHPGIKKIQEQAEITYQQSKGTPTEEIANIVSQEVQLWEISDQEQMTRNVESLIFSLKAKIPNIGANKHIFEEIENIKKEKDLVKQYQRIPILISLIPQIVTGGNLIMGDVFKNIQNATITNKSIVIDSFNKVKKEHDEEVAKALVQIAEFIENSGDVSAGILFNKFNEELNKPKAERSTLKQIWIGIEKTLPSIATISEVVAKLTPLF